METSKPSKEEKPSAENEAEAARRKSRKETDEIGGPKGLEPTRYGDWEVNGRCSDF